MIGKTISHYKILEKLGEGGMGVVYKAEDIRLKRIVALKFLPPDLTSDPEAKKRFVHEAQAASSLEHPNICNIHEINETEDGQTYIVMACYEGQTLRKLIQDKTLDVNESIRIVTQIAKGLSKAHQKGIIHRDIKPANIIIDEDGTVKILDFGLAKLSGQTMLTKSGTTMGTINYISPEQARGDSIDQRTDIWSIGVLMYEMLTGQLPFKGEYEHAVIYSILNEKPEIPKNINKDISNTVNDIILRALEKDKTKRFNDIDSIIKEFENIKSGQDTSISTEAGFRLKNITRNPGLMLTAIVLTIIMMLGVFWIYNRWVKIKWAKYTAIPKIQSHVELREWREAYNLVMEVEKIIPDDPLFINVLPEISSIVSIKSEPVGVKVYRKYYEESESDWEYVGRTNIDSIRFPFGLSILRLEKNGFQTRLVATWADWVSDWIFKMEKNNNDTEGMVRVPGRKFLPYLSGIDVMDSITVNDFFIDKYEVTNEEYKKFIDHGGYEKKEYWNHTFIKEGRILSWDKAMELFKDKTGRPGPSTWEAGDYLAGEANMPVSGICWYEAAAYAEFVGKKLPTIFHWDLAAGIFMSSYIIPYSNFKNMGSSIVGSYQGMSYPGNFDMAGNVREWCLNECSGNRFILGGGWNDETYMFLDGFTQPPIDRSITNGVRCIKLIDANTTYASMSIPIKRRFRDFRNESPVPDEVFNIYLRLFDYDKQPLNVQNEIIDNSNKFWTLEKVSITAAYGSERLIVYLYIPRNVNPPYQSVVFFPGSGAIHSDSIESWRTRNFDFIIKNGRAIIFPIYKGTYERRDDLNTDSQNESIFYRDHVIYWVKDLRRSVDYISSRDDLDSDKIGYFGVSWGAMLGGIIPAVEERIKVSILNVAGLSFGKTFPEADPFNFLPRIKTPVLMLNGKYDHFFPLETSQKPMFNLIGTAVENKRHVVYETGHFVPRNQLIKESLNWLDRHLGPVRLFGAD